MLCLIQCQQCYNHAIQHANVGPITNTICAPLALMAHVCYKS